MVTMSETTVRRALPGEQDRVVALWADAGLAAPTAEEWTTLAERNTSVLLVAEAAQELVGCAVATFDGWRAYIYHVAVAEVARHGGVAHALMEAAESYLQDAGAQYVYVMVPEENTAGLALAGSTGYSPEGDLVLSKALTDVAS
jgi:ribosomal protein S18 acetylase RimI-like enzyme